MIVGIPWSSLSPGLDGSRHLEELVCVLIPLFIWLSSAPQWPTFSSVEHSSLNPCWCLLPNTNIRRIKGNVEEWTRAVCTVCPNWARSGIRCARREQEALFAGLNMVFPSQPCFKTGLQEHDFQPSLCPHFPVFCTAQESQPFAGSLFRTGEQWQGDSGRVPMCLAEGCGFGVSVLQEGPVPPMALLPSTGEPSAPEQPYWINYVIKWFAGILNPFHILLSSLNSLWCQAVQVP